MPRKSPVLVCPNCKADESKLTSTGLGQYRHRGSKRRRVVPMLCDACQHEWWSYNTAAIAKHDATNAEQRDAKESSAAA